jgi:hypothetical protein
MDAPRFKVSYQGRADYQVGRRVVCVRHWGCERFAYAAGVWAQEIRPSIGTVRFESYPDSREFPSAEIMAHFPGYTAARWRVEGDRWTLETDGPAPATHHDPATGYLLATEPERIEQERAAALLAKLERESAARWTPGEASPGQHATHAHERGGA